MVALIQSLAGTISTSSSGTEIKDRISHKKLNESVATALHSALFVNSIDPLPTIPLFTFECSQTTQHCILGQFFNSAFAMDR